MFHCSTFIRPFERSIPLRRLCRCLLYLPIYLCTSMRASDSRRYYHQPPFRLGIHKNDHPMVSMRVLLRQLLRTILFIPFIRSYGFVSLMPMPMSIVRRVCYLYVCPFVICQYIRIGLHRCKWRRPTISSRVLRTLSIINTNGRQYPTNMPFHLCIMRLPLHRTLLYSSPFRYHCISLFHPFGLLRISRRPIKRRWRIVLISQICRPIAMVFYRFK